MTVLVHGGYFEAQYGLRIYEMARNGAFFIPRIDIESKSELV